LVPNN